MREENKDFYTYNYFSYPGPQDGTVSAQRTFSTGLFNMPIINKNDEIILVLRDSVTILNRNLDTVWEQSLTTPRTILPLSQGGILIGCGDNITFIDEKRNIKSSSLPEAIRKTSLTPFTQIYEGLDNRLYFLTGDALFCLDRNLNLIWSENLAQRFGLFGGWRLAICKNSQVFVSGAFSWISADDTIEYAGYLGSISPTGEFLWQKNHCIDSLPTSTGLSLRLAITSKNVWISERGAVAFDFDGYEVWRSDDEEGTTQIFAITPDDTVIFSQKQELLTVSEKDNYAQKSLISLYGWPHDVCLDNRKNIFTLSTEGLEAWKFDGEQIFRIDGLIGDNISIGNNILLVCSKRGKLSLIT